MRRRGGALATGVVAALAGAARSACGDHLVLDDGRVLFGEVVGESASVLRFRLQTGGAWTTVSVAPSRVERRLYEPGDQSDAGSPGARSPAGADPETPGGQGSRLVAVVPLHGQVGGTIRGSVEGTFDAAALRRCFGEAAAKGADLVVLDIDSPGGLVSEMEALCQAIIEWHDRLRIVAHPRDALSAAAIVCLCCREIVVRDDSRIGAAVIVRESRGGISAVDAKRASVHHARQRQYMAASGRPWEIVEAMTVREAQLWWSPLDGFASRPPRRSAAGWIRLDGEESVLTVTGREALDWGLAAASASSAADVASALGMGGAEIASVDLGAVVGAHNRALDDALRALRGDLRAYVGALEEVTRGLESYVGAARLGDHLAARRVASEILGDRARAALAVRRIRRADPAALWRRFGAHDDVMAQLGEDEALMAGLSGAMDGGGTDAALDAAQRLAAAVRRWRSLLEG